MKFIKTLLLLVAVAMIFSGCSFRLASSVDELITPVSPQGDDADVQNALSSYSNGGFTLKTPEDGDFTTAFSFYDIDRDSQDESIVFYESAKSLGKTNMAVIDKKDGKWLVVCNLESENSDVYSLDFSDLNGDGSTEIIVLWNLISDSKSHVLSVYSQNFDAEYSLSEISSSLTVNNYIVVDVDEDGVNDLMTFSVDSGDSVSASATLYSFEGNERKTLGSTKLDGHISFYESIISESKNGRVYIYADAVKSNGTQMLTEIIHWSDYYETVISPYYSYSTGVTKNTARSAMLCCRDINDDGFIEVPLDYDIGDLPDGVYAAEWNQYENSVMESVAYSIAVKKDDYQLILSKDVIDKIKVGYAQDKSELTITDSKDKLVLLIKCVPKSQSESISQGGGYSKIYEKAGYVYFAKSGSDSAVQFSIQELKSMIKSF